MAATKDTDRLGAVTNTGFATDWDWKGEYVSDLADGEGLERYSQFSATPDTTMLFAGPARFTGLSGDTGLLLPIGLTDGIQFQTDSQLARLYEIGSNRTFFTRGKTVSSLTFSKMLADQQNILRALTLNAYRPESLNIDGLKAPGAEAPNPDIMMNLDSEFFAVPFGILLVFKTRGGSTGTGKILSAVYLESCMFAGYAFQIAAAAPVITENVTVQFDRPVPVSFSN
jgi:hypothetical protein